MRSRSSTSFSSYSIAGNMEVPKWQVRGGPIFTRPGILWPLNVAYVGCMLGIGQLRGTLWSIRYNDVLEFILSDCPQGVIVLNPSVTCACYTVWMNAQTPIAKPNIAVPVRIFFTRYGCLALIKACACYSAWLELGEHKTARRIRTR